MNYSQLDNNVALSAVNAAIVGGKLDTAQKDWAVAYFLRDPSGFMNYNRGAEKKIPLAQIEYHLKPILAVLDGMRQS